jgi:hypothetical protein
MGMKMMFCFTMWCFGQWDCVVVDLGRTCVCGKLSPYVLGVMVDCVRLGSVPFLVGFVDSVSGCTLEWILDVLRVYRLCFEVLCGSAVAIRMFSLLFPVVC